MRERDRDSVCVEESALGVQLTFRISRAVEAQYRLQEGVSTLRTANTLIL